MANDYRDRGRNRGRGENRGMVGYEGEGYLRGIDASRGPDRGDFGAGYPGGDFNEPGYGRYGGYRGETFFGRESQSDRGYSDLERSRSERPSFRGRGPKGYQRSDDRIREDVCERLSWDDDVDATEIEVNVTGATVMLSGSVSDRYAKRRAEDIAESVIGVKDVQNQIRISREE